MIYKNIVRGIFIKRENRFIAYVNINNQIHKTYVPNTGRCKELLIEGVEVILTKSDNPKRATKFTLVSVYKNGFLINIDSQAPNKIVFESIKNKKILTDIELTILIPEKTYGNSRFDIYYEGIRNNKLVKGFIEVKGVTLEIDNVAYFPDAPTLRGLKHLKELELAYKDGYESSVLFLVQMKNITHFSPNKTMQKEFAKTLANVSNNGVNILCYDSIVKPNEVIIDNKIPVKLLI